MNPKQATPRKVVLYVLAATALLMTGVRFDPPEEAAVQPLSHARKYGCCAPASGGASSGPGVR